MLKNEKREYLTLSTIWSIPFDAVMSGTTILATPSIKI